MLKTWLFLFSFITHIYLIYAANPVQRPVVETPLGKIRGYHKKSAKENTFSAFEGIPYAKPPIEDLRFAPPEAVEPWIGIWDASFVTECPQTPPMQSDVIQGDEDCLHVNVYVPREQPNPEEKLDVIVHIHDGFFMYGSGHAYSHPEYFMDEDVIFVTFNYRLGFFGFLSTQDNVVSGNNGLKDQVMVLKWIQDNIASFGGNPGSVTLTGLSTGASCVHYHYLSFLSLGLFHKGFSQSGAVLNYFAQQERSLAKAKILAEAVGCPSSVPSYVIIKCLKQKPFQQLMATMPLFFGYKFFPLSPFGPVMEKGSDPFIYLHPYESLSKRKIQDLPWLTSSVYQEGLFPATSLINDLETVDKEWTTLAPFLLDFNGTLSQSFHKETAEKIRNRYFEQGEEINEKSFSKLVQIFSDRFLVDFDGSIKWQSKAKKGPVYYYQFGYSGDFNENNAVTHSADARYFFYNMDNKQLSANELKMKDIMMEMLITFAKTGKPKILDLNWPPVKFPEITLLNITGFEPENIKLQTVKELAPRGFWKNRGFWENQKVVV